jgi:hypothetical protein
LFLEFKLNHASGATLERRAVQLGLRGDVLARYSRDWIVSIEDISDFVQNQYQVVRSQNWAQLLISSESVLQIYVQRFTEHALDGSLPNCTILAEQALGLGLLMPNMNVCLTSVTPVSLRGRVLGGLMLMNIYCCNQRDI